MKKVGEGFLTRLIIALVALYAAGSFLSIQFSKNDNVRERNELQAEVDIEQQKNSRLNAYMSGDLYALLPSIAWERFGYLNPGDVCFEDVSGN